MKRQKMSGSKSRKVFSHGASLIHRKNITTAPMRGGIRL